MIWTIAQLNPEFWCPGWLLGAWSVNRNTRVTASLSSVLGPTPLTSWCAWASPGWSSQSWTGREWATCLLTWPGTSWSRSTLRAWPTQSSPSFSASSYSTSFSSWASLSSLSSQPSYVWSFTWYFLQVLVIQSYHSIKLLTFIHVLELLPDEAAQTQNPYVILFLYYQGWFMWLGFLIHAFYFEIWSQT